MRPAGVVDDHQLIFVAAKVDVAVPAVQTQIAGAHPHLIVVKTVGPVRHIPQEVNMQRGAGIPVQEPAGQFLISEKRALHTGLP